MKNLTCSISLILCCHFIAAQTAVENSTDNLNLNTIIGRVSNQNIFINPDYYTWGSSVMKGKDGRYHMFYSRWKHGKRHTLTGGKLFADSLNYIFDDFRGWQKYSEIAHAVSKNLYGPYKFQNVILKGTGDTTRWDRFTMHNPGIYKFGDKYYLYYISNNFNKDYQLAGADANTLQWMKYNACQSIGVLVANSVEDLVAGKYKRIPEPIMTYDNVNTFEVVNNPSVTQGADGKYYMMFKSHKANAGHMTLWIAQADTPIGEFKIIGNVFDKPEYAVEDPFFWYDKQRKRYYAVVKNFSKSSELNNEFGALVLITSENLQDWHLAKNGLVSKKQYVDTEGKTHKLNHLERPFLYFDEKGNPKALFAAAALMQPGSTKDLINTFNLCLPLNAKK